MKKTLALVLIAALVLLTFAACGNAAPASTETANDAAEAVEEVVEAAAENTEA